MSRLLVCCLTVLLACSFPARAGQHLADVEVYDRTAGHTLDLYRHDGRLYVAGEPRHEYEVRVHSRYGGRLLAVTSVDGVNVITGDTAATDQDGYVLDGFSGVDIAGWRKSLQRVAAFYFTALPDSYAARTGRPDNVGVIGVALFREKAFCCRQPLPRDEAPGASPDAAAQPPAPPASTAAPEPSLERGRAKAAMEDKLGTGHGRSEYSAVTYTDFERESDAPNEVISIFYDSRRNLVAQGVIPDAWRADRRPEAFPAPGHFAPDP
ncbi:MAG: hypothetical protein P4L83_08225 [Nevskia sp.]|nr:hypothetical protein [Nevskia sp.]